MVSQLLQLLLQQRPRDARVRRAALRPLRKGAKISRATSRITGYVLASEVYGIVVYGIKVPDHLVEGAFAVFAEKTASAVYAEAVDCSGEE